MMDWLSLHALNLVLILAVTFLLLWLARLGQRRFVAWLAHRGDFLHGRENQARTLAGVVQYVAAVTIILAGTAAVLNELAIDVTVFMGGAAVVGLAVAFGTQNLIKDYFTGFVILLERQYTLNDVVRIGSCTGTVEQLTLRLTALRDQDGTLHFIPNGQITTVSNLTHGWSAAVLEIAVPLKEDLDRVSETLLTLARDLRGEAAFRDLIIDEPEMLGVEGLQHAAVTVKLLVKTRPGQQWQVKRELLRRIKNRFDELKIEIA